MHPFTNNLITETSPYLLQHAHNPVNWFPWGEEALDLAKKENKPILVSIGYSACHWCHVMERESFEDEETARLMNNFFINIKIDREERPDLDHIYMDAVQAMTGSGGWPLNVFLTPERKPFYGGTYFPPRRAFNRPSWKEILTSIQEAFNNRRNEIDAQAENLTEHLIASNKFGINSTDENAFFTKTKTDEIFNQIMKNADKTWGGFGRAPKFPQTFVIQYLLRYNYVTKNDEALQQAILSIDKMINGGIYDHIGGGFARYSTDTEWLVPHFEKMLYDNALLLSVISEAFQVTKNKRYAEVIDETVSFLIREMSGNDGGYYAALDADSEGEEGKFYVWKRDEVEEELQEDAAIFCGFFDISEEGNWESKNIPWRKYSQEGFCRENKLEIEELDKIIITGKTKLLQKRQNRIRPGTDDKILLSWNALLCVAFSKAYCATGNKNYKEFAIKLIAFLESRFYDNEREIFFHSFKNGLRKQPAFLDDLAYLVQAMIHIQEITGDSNYLLKARQISEHIIEEFSDENSIFFYFTSVNQSDIIIRKKEIYDGAQPSGNAIMADNLYRLAIYFDIPAWLERAQKMLESLGKALANYPTSFALWCNLFQEIVDGTNELVLISEDWQKILYQLNNEYIPHRVLMSSPESVPEFPLLSGKQNSGKTTIFLCRNYTCDTPVSSVSELIERIGHK